MPILPKSAHRRDARAVEGAGEYDAVIVGSGVAGAIIAAELCQAGKRVLMVEAATDETRSFDGYQGYLNHFYSQVSKDNQAPFPVNPDAPMPRGSDVKKLAVGEVNSKSYIVQTGPYVTDTVYSRAFGGTTIHWEAKTPRMLPGDFKTQNDYRQGKDWPLSYEDMEPDYERAEFEIGVSADVDHQTYLGLRFREGYVYPMHGLPLSYLDQKVAAGIRGVEIELDGQKYPLTIRPFPQGRNAVPNEAYRGSDGKRYAPVGAVAGYELDQGERCQGNTNCVPICPVQAKYHAGKTLAKAFATGRLEFVSRSVASEILYERGSGRITGINVKAYADANSPEHTVVKLKGKIYVIAANAVETPRLLLASKLPNFSDQIGRNLMDHAYLLSWGLMPEICGTMRGTTCTGGIVDLRDGSFRQQQAAFSVDIHNDGWGWATGAPFSDVREMVDVQNKFGPALRRALIERVSHQLMLAFMIEVMPSPDNRVTVDHRYRDALDNPKPVFSFKLSDYTMRGAACAREVAKTMFTRLGVSDYTRYSMDKYGSLEFEGSPFEIRGGNHLAGTHVMGTDCRSSVVNTDQRCWDHENLYLVGAGSMPTIGTANVTLTLAALAYRSARDMVRQLNAASH